MARVHILGNSGSYGFNEKDTSWPSLLKANTNRRRAEGQKPRVTVVQLSSPGNMLSHILDSGLFEASVKCNQRGKQIGMFSVGACEASILSSLGQKEPRRSKTEFSRDLDKLHEITKKLNSDRPNNGVVSSVLLGTFPANNDKSLHTPEGDYFNDEVILEYDQILREKAKENNTTYVDLRTGFDIDSMLSEDGTHLNMRGDGFVYSKVMPALLAELGIITP